VVATKLGSGHAWEPEEAPWHARRGRAAAAAADAGEPRSPGMVRPAGSAPGPKSLTVWPRSAVDARSGARTSATRSRCSAATRFPRTAPRSGSTSTARDAARAFHMAGH